MTERNGSVSLIECPCGPAKIGEVLAVMPDTVVGAVVADGLDGQSVGGKWFPVIDQMGFWSDDLK